MPRRAGRPAHRLRTRRRRSAAPGWASAPSGWVPQRSAFPPAPPGSRPGCRQLLDHRLLQRCHHLLVDLGHWPAADARPCPQRAAGAGADRAVDVADVVAEVQERLLRPHVELPLLLGGQRRCGGATRLRLPRAGPGPARRRAAARHRRRTRPSPDGSWRRPDHSPRRHRNPGRATRSGACAPRPWGRPWPAQPVPPPAEALARRPWSRAPVPAARAAAGWSRW